MNGVKMKITKNTTAEQFISMVDAELIEKSIPKMHEELVENFISNGIDESNLRRGLDNFNIVESFIKDSQVKTDNAKDLPTRLQYQIQETENKARLETFSSPFVNLFQKYEYDSVMQNLFVAREKFDSFRRDYLFKYFIKESKGTLIQGNVLGEECFIVSIDVNLKLAKNMGADVTIVYEDIDGKEKHLRTCLKEEGDIYIDEEDNFEMKVSYRPEGYWIGHNSFDGFRIQYYWNLDEEDWTPVPIHLIRRLVLSSQEDMSNNPFDDEDDDMMGDFF
jgi:hypothetical protein